MRNLMWFMVGFTLILLLGVVIPADGHAEEYVYVEVSQGIKIGNMPWGNSNWEGDYPTEIAVGYHTGNRERYLRVEGRHTSNILDGAPFNDRSETWLDAVMFTYGLKFQL